MEMTVSERGVFLQKTVRQVVSRDELCQRLTKAGCTEVVCEWLDVLPDDLRLVEARTYYIKYGRLVSRNGALVSIEIGSIGSWERW